MNTIVLSASSLSRSVACRRAWCFQYYKRLRRRAVSDYLTLGRAYHAGLASYYTYKSLSEAMEAASSAIKEDVKSGALYSLEQPSVTTEVCRLLTSYVEFAEMEDRRTELCPIAVENKFAFPVDKESKVWCVGVIDLYAETKYGPSIIDHKTASSCGASYFRDSEYDIQAYIYMMAAERLGIEANYFTWNVIAKTKTPYVQRYSIIPTRARLERYARELAAHAATIPAADNPMDIPGNPGACRTCMYKELCEYPEQYKSIIESEFTVASYEEWGL